MFSAAVLLTHHRRDNWLGPSARQLEVGLRRVLPLMSWFSPPPFPCAGRQRARCPPQCAVHSPQTAQLLCLAWWELAWLQKKKTCLDTDVIKIQVLLKESYLQMCPALEPASPAQTRCARRIAEWWEELSSQGWHQQ